MTTSKRRGAVLWLLLLCLSLPACSVFTSIKRDPNGAYVLTGVSGGTGFVWVCDYDPATKTLTVKK
jgi:hypothetical protein